MRNNSISDNEIEKGLSSITNKFAMIQFSLRERPDLYSGYTIDDNARALISASKLGNEEYIDRYLNCIDFCSTEYGFFHNEVSHEKKFLDDVGSEDSFGRTIWGLGESYSFLNYEQQTTADKLIEKSINNVFSLESLKAKSFTLIGLVQYLNLDSYLSKDVKLNIKNLSNDLVETYNNYPENDWFEEILSYENARIPQSLFQSYNITNSIAELETAILSLKFLESIVWDNGLFNPVGNEGWYRLNQPLKQKPKYDQQPVDVGAMVECYVDAYKVLGIEDYKNKANNVYEWYFGNNTENLEMYDKINTRVFDGLRKGRVNKNQGAESLLSIHLAEFKLREMD
jgi:hypothetical protein